MWLAVVFADLSTASSMPSSAGSRDVRRVFRLRCTSSEKASCREPKQLMSSPHKRLQTIMEDIFVGRLMSTGIITVAPESPVEDAAEILLEENIGSVVAVDGDNQPKGILTSTDFVRIVAEDDVDEQATVSEYMTEDLVTVSVQDEIREAADKMITYHIHHLPVVDDVEGVIGMLSTTDLTAYFSEVEEPSPA